MTVLVGRISDHFTWSEFASHDETGDVTVPPAYKANAYAVAKELERIRRCCGNKPLTVSCVYRTPSHNASLKPPGAPNSQHLYALAADVIPPVEGMTTLDLARLIYMLATEPESKIRYIKRYDAHCHFDLRQRDTVLTEGF